MNHPAHDDRLYRPKSGRSAATRVRTAARLTRALSGVLAAIAVATMLGCAEPPEHRPEVEPLVDGVLDEAPGAPSEPRERPCTVRVDLEDVEPVFELPGAVLGDCTPESCDVLFDDYVVLPGELVGPDAGAGTPCR